MCKKPIVMLCGVENPASSISWAKENMVLMERQAITATRVNAIIFLNFEFKRFKTPSSTSAHLSW